MTRTADAVAEAVTNKALIKTATVDTAVANTAIAKIAKAKIAKAETVVAKSTAAEPRAVRCPVSRRFGAPVSEIAAERSSWLWQAWRLVGMPVFYPLFGLGCVVGLLGAILIRFSTQDTASRVRANRRLLSTIARCWLWVGCALRLLEWEAWRPVRGQLANDAATESEKAAAEPEAALHAGAATGGAVAPGRLLVANHPTLIDVLFMVSLEPELCCVLKADLNRHWVFARLIRELDYLSNADPERLLAEGALRLRSGETLLVFPEGTRTVPGQEVAFRQGAAAIAVRAGVPVEPVVIEYRSAYLSKGYPWYALPKQRLRYRFRYGEPVHSAPLAKGDGPAARHARRRARRQLNATLEELVNRQLAASTLPALPAEEQAVGRPLGRLHGADL